jgi:hypothetical protein
MASSMETDPAAHDGLRKPVGATNGAQHAHHEPIINVQPPRREDLQPSYAQTLVGDNDVNLGWYGSMSTSIPLASSSIAGRAANSVC